VNAATRHRGCAVVSGPAGPVLAAAAVAPVPVPAAPASPDEATKRYRRLHPTWPVNHPALKLAMAIGRMGDRLSVTSSDCIWELNSNKPGSHARYERLARRRFWQQQAIDRLAWALAELAR
jgi:hypothetical protein